MECQRINDDIKTGQWAEGVNDYSTLVDHSFRLG